MRCADTHYTIPTVYLLVLRLTAKSKRAFAKRLPVERASMEPMAYWIVHNLLQVVYVELVAVERVS